MASRIAASLLMKSPLLGSVRQVSGTAGAGSRTLSTSLCRLKFEVINIQDDDHFKKEVLESKEPVVVDFHATWCGPCKMLAPRLEKVMSEDGKLKLVKVDIDNFEDLAMKYRVRGVPAVFAFKNGKTVDSFVGLAEEDKIDAFIAKLSHK